MAAVGFKGKRLEIPCDLNPRVATIIEACFARLVELLQGFPTLFCSQYYRVIFGFILQWALETSFLLWNNGIVEAIDQTCYTSSSSLKRVISYSMRGPKGHLNFVHVKTEFSKGLSGRLRCCSYRFRCVFSMVSGLILLCSSLLVFLMVENCFDFHGERKENLRSWTIRQI